MGELTIRFRHNNRTGRRELVVHLESDSDVLSHEHESDHRRFLGQLLGTDIADDTDIIIERLEPGSIGDEPMREADGAAIDVRVAEKAKG